MKFEVQSLKFEELRGADGRRRGSVLVLVMTLLGILFVLGVAFLATMNFEADMIAFQRQRDRADNGVATAAVDVGSMLRDSMMVAPGLPFGDTSVALSSAAYAEMPGVQNAASPIEPIHASAGLDGVWGNGDDEIVFNSYFDAKAIRSKPFTGPSIQPGFTIDSRNANNTEIFGYTITIPGSATPFFINLRRCTDGPFKGQRCGVSADCQINATDPPYACEGARVADADGDGIVDSLLVDAADIGLSGPQLAELAARVNPASNPTGRVSVALRVIAHGGMVSLNDSHPNLIQNVLGLTQWWANGDPAQPDPNFGNFVHRPTQWQTLYSPMLEESLLRRRALLPPPVVPSSTLQGSALLDKTKDPAGLADMAWYLYPPKWPGGALAGSYETVFDHRSAPFSPTELSPAGDPNLNLTLWAVRMEPFTSQIATLTDPTKPEYDRRHLVTTVSQDDLLARGGTLTTPSGSEDLRQVMIEANQSAWDPNLCPRVLPFEYADYPPDIKNETDPQLAVSPYDKCECPTDLYCRFDPRKGRLQLSLPWIDDALAAAGAITDPVLREEARQRVFHAIHDAFFMLVRNAATPLKVEGMHCTADADCPVKDTVCSATTFVCVHLGNPGGVPTFAGCNATAPCAIPGSNCADIQCRSGDRKGLSCVSNADCPGGVCGGVCELVAPAWRDKDCRIDTDCNTVPGQNGEFCLITTPGSPPTGVCADRWTKQRRSEALIARTAASLTANLIDFADRECSGGPRNGEICQVAGDCPSGSCNDRGVPTRVAIRHLGFTDKCRGGTRHNLPCDPVIFQTTPNDPIYGCPNDGSCVNPAGREIDLVPDISSDPASQGVQPVYVYGLERQPYITEVATLADANDPNKPLVGWAAEIFNPYPLGIPASDLTNNEEYFIYEGDPGGTLATAHVVPLSGVFQGMVGSPPIPFTTYYSLNPPGTIGDLLGNPPVGVPIQISGTSAFTFKNNWTLYLVRRVQFTGDPAPTNIVVDQFNVKGDTNDLIGKEGGDLAMAQPGTPFQFSVGRVVQQAAPWTATVPVTHESAQGAGTLGTWNSDILDQKIHPVEVNFANTGWFGPHIFNPTAVPAFPTTGSLSLLIRQANRSTADFIPPGGKVTNLAFTSSLKVDPTVEDTASIPVKTSAGPPPTFLMDGGTIIREEQIDNGRMPLFDLGVLGVNPATGRLAAHHLPPQLLKAWNPDPAVNDPSRSLSPLPGDLNTLPWGQLVFDYFTALPLSNPGPYLVADPNMIGVPESQPRVDREGARVYGRINLNAAPWTVLAGLPFVPMDRTPRNTADPLTWPWSQIKAVLGLTIADTEAGTIGADLSQAIVAYREARSLPGPAAANFTGNYDDGTPAAGVLPTPATTYPRGWTNANPASRRGTGFMGVGELANVRHPGAAGQFYKTDSGVIGSKTNKNEENFIDAAAVLIALGDWATVRSQVFTVYGQLRGDDDQTIADPVLRRQDADSRAIRFQETIDRLPTFFGEPLPRRIGAPTVAKLTDVNND